MGCHCLRWPFPSAEPISQFSFPGSKLEMFPSLSADAKGAWAETEAFRAAHHETRHNKHSQGRRGAFLEHGAALSAFLHRTAQQPVRSGTVTAFACQTVGFLSLSLSPCLWCNAVFSALAASLTGALRVLEKTRGLLCKASLHAATVPIFGGSTCSPVIEQEHKEDLLCPSSASCS